jgi:hypothetical protein
VCEYEGFAHNKDVLSFIAEEVRGVPRNALVWLNKVATEGSWTVSAAKELGGDTSDEENPKIYDLSKALNKGLFKEVLPVYDKITNVPIETIRITVSLYFAACLRKSRNVAEARKFSAVLDVLSTPIYEQGKPAEIKWLNYMFKVTDTIAEHSRRR